MHILAIIGSMRKNGHTHTLINHVLDAMRELGPDLVTDIVHVADKTLHPCRVTCSRYCTTHPYQCAVADDVPAILQQMIAADAVLLGAPLYFRGPPAKFQALAERLISLFFFHETQGEDRVVSPLKDKPCGLVGVAEYANPHQILEYLHDFCTVLKMRPLVLDRFPYLGVAGQDDLMNDEIFHPFARSRDLAEALINACTQLE
jgi:multimeric flavodoxin WrbA